MRIKQVMVQLLLMVELCVFGYAYMYGNNGMGTLQARQKEVDTLRTTIEQLKKEVAAVESEILVWQTNDFYKERIAREQLQMARKDDQLFYIGT
jgi:cell division protein FtsB